MHVGSRLPYTLHLYRFWFKSAKIDFIFNDIQRYQQAELDILFFSSSFISQKLCVRLQCSWF